MKNRIDQMESETVVKTKVSATIDKKLVEWMDDLIGKGVFRNKSHIIEEALIYLKKRGIKEFLLEKLEKEKTPK